jgi:hypothetical protein
MQKVTFEGEHNEGTLKKSGEFEEYLVNLRKNDPYLGRENLITEAVGSALATSLKITPKKNTNQLFELKSNFLAPLTTRSEKPKTAPPKQAASQGKAPANNGKSTPAPSVKGNNSNQPAANTDKKKHKKK